MSARLHILFVAVLSQLASCFAAKVEASAFLRGRRSNTSVSWGNDAALRACFGDNYKAYDGISHCFQEHDTHNTCCMMDEETRHANDAAGNLIGQASLDAYEAINGGLPESTSELLTPWCTCFGSQVCSHYAS